MHTGHQHMNASMAARKQRAAMQLFSASTRQTLPPGEHGQSQSFIKMEKQCGNQVTWCCIVDVPQSMLHGAQSRLSPHA